MKILFCVVLITGTWLASIQPAFAAVAPKETPGRYELIFWNSIKDSSDPEEYQAYLDEYPDGRFSRLAKIRIKRLRQAGSAPSAAPASTPAPSPAPTPTPEPAAAPKEKPKPQVVKPAVVAPAPEPVAPASSAATPEKDCNACPELVAISGGSFKMGSKNAEDDASPVHTVKIGYRYYISRYEVTQHEWNTCVSDGGCKESNRYSPASGADLRRAPVSNISWVDAQNYVSWLKKKTQKNYRLPSEAEWEFAARAGSSKTYWWGNNMRKGMANCRDCGGEWSKKWPASVDAFPANALGLYGTAGGVSEWVQDCWVPNYNKAPRNGTAREKSGCSRRVLRGGSWKNKANYARSASRLGYDHDVRYLTNGFRVVRE